MNDSKVRIIFHIDMNMFFCSVAVIKNPSLKGKAFAIGREGTTKGVLSTASYEARKYGIHSAMPQIEAIRKLPSLIIVNSDFKMYKEYHNKFIKLIGEYTDTIEVASIDEVYADMTEICKKRNALDVAKEIQVRLVKEYHLPCSIGIAPTLYLAKMASDIKKPLGITVLRKRDVKNILYPLKVEDIFGIGKKTSPKLHQAGINTIADFMNPINKSIILEVVGEKTYNAVVHAMEGKSSNQVDPDRWSEVESISTSQTFDIHLDCYEQIYVHMKELLKKVHQRLIKEGYYTKTITLTLRDESFKTITRSKSVDYTNSYQYILDTLEDLLDENYNGDVIRLVGVGLHSLKKEEDMEIEYNLFTYQSFLAREEKINDVIEKINDKYHSSVIKKGLENWHITLKVIKLKMYYKGDYNYEKWKLRILYEGW